MLTCTRRTGALWRADFRHSAKSFLSNYTSGHNYWFTLKRKKTLSLYLESKAAACIYKTLDGPGWKLKRIILLWIWTSSVKPTWEVSRRLQVSMWQLLPATSPFLIAGSHPDLPIYDYFACWYRLSRLYLTEIYTYFVEISLSGRHWTIVYLKVKCTYLFIIFNVRQWKSAWY